MVSPRLTFERGRARALTNVDVDPRCVVLGLFHHSGAPQTYLLLAEDSPVGADDGSGPIDVVVVASSRRRGSDAWIDHAIETAIDRVADDGVLWTLVPRRHRGRVERALAAHRIEVTANVMLVPSWTTLRNLVPLEPRLLGDAVRREFGWGRASARMAALAARVPLGRRLFERRSTVALLAARGPAAPLRWLAALDGSASASATVSAATRPEARVAILMRYPAQRSAPDLVVKVAFDDAGAARLERQRVALELVAPTGKHAGATIPALRASGDKTILGVSVEPGTNAAALVTSAPRRLQPTLAPIIGWIMRWNSATATSEIATDALLTRLVGDYCNRVAEWDPSLSPYRDRVLSLCEHLHGQPFTLVATHEDLTAVNVLVGDDAITVVDWEWAQPHGLPLVDLWDVLSDSLRRAYQIPRVEAVRALVDRRAPAPSWMVDALDRVRTSLGLSQEQSALSFHAAWLRHAVREIERNDTSNGYIHVLRAIASGGITVE